VEGQDDASLGVKEQVRNELFESTQLKEQARNILPFPLSLNIRMIQSHFCLLRSSKLVAYE
jgi:hypothetical protein